MAKTLLNYTTEVPADRSVAEVQRRLAAHGAAKVMVEYEPGGVPAAVAFAIATEFGERTFLLPARTAAVAATLEALARQRKIAPRYATPEQAARVAWRIVKDWVEAQLALLQLGAVRLEEVMLPYMQVGRSGETLYELARSHQLGLPARA